jgi:hypothetical protein
MKPETSLEIFSLQTFNRCNFNHSKDLSELLRSLHRDLKLKLPTDFQLYEVAKIYHPIWSNG